MEYCHGTVCMPLLLICLSLYHHLSLSNLFLSCRVKGMLMVNILAIVAGLLMGLCRMWKPHIMVIAGRAVMGFYCGTVKQMLQFILLIQCSKMENHHS